MGMNKNKIIDIMLFNFVRCKMMCFFFFFRFYLFIHDRHAQREREAETQAEGEADSMQGAHHGTRSRVSRITPWAEGGAKPLSHPGCPDVGFLMIPHESEIM